MNLSLIGTLTSWNDILSIYFDDCEKNANTYIEGNNNGRHIHCCFFFFVSMSSSSSSPSTSLDVTKWSNLFQEMIIPVNCKTPCLEWIAQKSDNLIYECSNGTQPRRPQAEVVARSSEQRVCACAERSHCSVFSLLPPSLVVSLLTHTHTKPALFCLFILLFVSTSTNLSRHWFDNSCFCIENID